MKEIIYLSLVTASISYTVTETRLFMPLREWIKKRNSFLGKILFCGYCFGFWIALALVVIIHPRLFELWWLLDYFLTALAVAWLSGFQWAAMCWMMEKAGK